jgi:5'-nucleotidase (lipoprotein e(P4) family)
LPNGSATFWPLPCPTASPPLQPVDEELMSAARLPRGATTGFVGLIAGLFAGQALTPSRAEPQVPPVAVATATNPQEKRVLANLYMQSAEYRACCLQTYKVAAERLVARLRTLPPEGLPPAVVMDLDETVFDNAAFQEFLYRNRLVYRDELWEPWERDHAHEVGLVPGAKNFIATAELAGAKVVYISNRMTKYKDSTVKALVHNGMNVEGITGRLLLKESSTDKTQRRAVAYNQHRVLMYIGDSLRDFSEDFKVVTGNTTVASRNRVVDDAAARWGQDWFILPNPSYGEWERLLGERPETQLRPTTMQLPAPIRP